MNAKAQSNKEKYHKYLTTYIINKEQVIDNSEIDKGHSQNFKKNSLGNNESQLVQVHKSKTTDNESSLAAALTKIEDKKKEDKLEISSKEKLETEEDYEKWLDDILKD